MLQKKAVSLTFVFENCETISIDIDKVDIMELSGIISKVSKFHDDQVMQYKDVKDVAIRISPDIMNETCKAPFGGIMFKHVRIGFGDITAIEILYDNGEHEIYYVDYKDSDDGTLNVNQSTVISGKDYLYIVISDSMDVHDYFNSYIELENEQVANKDLPKAYHFVWVKGGNEDAVLAMRVYSPFSEDGWDWLLYTGGTDSNKNINRYADWSYASKDEFSNIEEIIEFFNIILVKYTPIDETKCDASISSDIKAANMNDGFYAGPVEEKNIEYYKNKIKESVKAAQDAIAGRTLIKNVKENTENLFMENDSSKESNHKRPANEDELEERIKKTQRQMDMRKISHEASSLIGGTVGLVKHAAENAIQSREVQKVKDAVHNAGDKAANVAGKTLHDIIYSDYVQKNRENSNKDA